MTESYPLQTDIQIEKILSKIRRYRELVVEEEIEYVERRKSMDEDTLRNFHNSLLSFSSRLLAPVIQSLENGSASQLSISELVGKTIDKHILKSVKENEEIELAIFKRRKDE